MQNCIKNGLAFAGGTVADVPQANATANLFPVNDGLYHHVVGVARDGESYSLWIDGALVETRTNLLPNITNSVNSVLIGGNPDTPQDDFRTWNGNIDDVAVWKRALSDDEVNELFTNGNSIQFLIDNDVTPTPLSGGEVVIEDCGFNADGGFDIEVSNLTIGRTYQLMSTLLLDGTDLTPIGETFTGEETHTFTDSNPPTGSGANSFYMISDVTP